MWYKRLHDRMGLKWRLILGVSTLLLTSSLMLSIFLIGEFSDSAVTALEKRGASLARNLAYNAEFGVLLENTDELNALAEGVMGEEDVLFSDIYNSNGQLLVHRLGVDLDSIHISRFNEDFNMLVMADSLRNGTVTNRHTLSDGCEYIEVLNAVRSARPEMSREELGSTLAANKDDPNGRHVIGYIRLGISLDQTNTQISKTTQMIVYFTLLLVMLGILLSVTLVKMIASPINALVEATERIAAGNLSQRVHVETDQELQRLAIAFNQMCDSLAKSQSELEQHNLMLEQRVIERTQKLEQAQRQVVQSEKMAAVGQLAAGVAHELNNPLGGILGYSQFALEKTAGETLGATEVMQLRRYLSDIEAQARRCKMIVKNLLKFSRSSDKPEFGLVDINQSLEETFVFTSHQLNMKDIQITKRLTPHLPPINGNANLLQQVFTNIIINSMQSMPNGGELTVTTVYCQPVGEFSGTIEIRFKDTGSGIPEEIRNKIFEPFFTTKKIGEGTRLGLSVSYGIVREHGGEIKLESSVGVGSTFTVVLPIVKETTKVRA